MQALLPIADLASCARELDGVLTDIDDTLTTGGKLTPEAFSALHSLRDCGLKVVPITGGPASLALHAARLWPVDAAIGESGAVAYWMSTDAHGRRHLKTEFWQDEATRHEQAALRSKVATRVLQAVPGAALASDQVFRLCDLAIDYCEDVTPLSAHQISTIKQILHAASFTVRQSSIHLNTWAGTYDKLPMAKRCLQSLFGVDVEQCRHRWLYVGDAPNDEEMFGYFPRTVGVANIARHLPAMQHHPTHITQGEAGEGFAELAALLCTARQKSAIQS
jgi:HAD superfamily hydrolase (TIGR01484 family)